MIITRTPFRISFFGGGTDYPAWYRDHGGAVISVAINKYCYITCRYLPPFFNYKSRIVWSHIEHVSDHADILHPAVREVLQFLDIREGVEIHHNADLPSRSGLGSSSAFTVGLLNALHALQGKTIDQDALARVAIHVEQNVLKENVGTQDQVAAACGGFNKIEFSKEREFHCAPIVISPARLADLQAHLMLVFTGFSRTASIIVAEQVKNIPHKYSELRSIHQMVDEAMNILASERDITEFGRLLHESWKLKRSLSDKITNPKIDSMYEAACHAGAIGGKLLGAGGGGFLILFVKPERREGVRTQLSNLLEVPFRFEGSGSQVLSYNNVSKEL